MDTHLQVCHLEQTTTSTRKDTDGLNYYRDMVDLEGLDPDLAGIAASWLAPPTQSGLLAYLFKEGRLDLVQMLIREGIVDQTLGEKVVVALRTASAIYKDFRVEGYSVGLESMTPRMLAENELLLWRPSLAKGEDLRRALSVEIPVRQDWVKRGVDSRSEESVLSFYRESESYIFELMAANNLIQTLYNYGVTLAKMIDLGITEFLDYGAGIGSFVLLGKGSGFSVRHMDLEGKTLDFARWRYAIRGLDVPILCARGNHADIPDSCAVVCTEVIEHLFDPLALLNRLTKIIPAGGYVIISESCGYVEKFISHLSANQWLAGRAFAQEMEARGFLEVLPEPRVHPRIFRRLG